MKLSKELPVSCFGKLLVMDSRIMPGETKSWWSRCSQGSVCLSRLCFSCESAAIDQEEWESGWQPTQMRFAHGDLLPPDDKLNLLFDDDTVVPYQVLQPHAMIGHRF